MALRMFQTEEGFWKKDSWHDQNLWDADGISLSTFFPFLFPRPDRNWIRLHFYTLLKRKIVISNCVMLCLPNDGKHPWIPSSCNRTVSNALYSKWRVTDLSSFALQISPIRFLKLQKSIRSIRRLLNRTNIKFFLPCWATYDFENTNRK